jgi:hypothetical protein
MIDYTSAGIWAQVVRALAMTETNEVETLDGDGGQAHGLLQQHPSFFSQWYKQASTTDTWTRAYIKACAAYLTWAVPMFGLSGAIQAYNLGAEAYSRGERNPEYLKRFEDNYSKLGFLPNDIPKA